MYHIFILQKNGSLFQNKNMNLAVTTDNFTGLEFSKILNFPFQSEYFDSI